VEDRLAQLARLRRKYGATLEELIARRDQLSAELHRDGDGAAEVTLEIHYHATQNQPRPVLIGFSTELDKEFFEKLITVKDVGPLVAARSLAAPVSGVVLEKNALEGQQVMPGMRLYRVADLTSVWAEGEVFERDLRYLHEGTPVHLEVEAYPSEHLMGRVAFVYPTVDQRTRTTRVRVTIPNPGLRLKPGMFATVFFDAEIGRNVLTVPAEAVLATGERNLVFVRGDNGVLEPRSVVVGDRAAGRTVILDGLREGERVVAAANFLVDAESRLRVGAAAMPGHQHGAGAPPEPQPEHRHD